MNTDTKIWIMFGAAFTLCAMGFVHSALGQEVAYCKNAQTGKVIVIQAGYACPQGFYRIRG